VTTFWTDEAASVRPWIALQITSESPLQVTSLTPTSIAISDPYLYGLSLSLQRPQRSVQLSTKRCYHMSCAIPYYHSHASLLPFREHNPVNIHIIASQLWRDPFYDMVPFCHGLWSFICYLEFLQQTKRASLH